MILKREIEKIAEHKKVAKATIDKDWVLDHFIDAIFFFLLLSLTVARKY